MFLLLVLSKLYYIICVYVIDIVINPIDVYCISNLISCFKASKDNYLTFVVPLHKMTMCSQYLYGCHTLLVHYVCYDSY